jgi:hypothetical protein
VRRTAQSIHQSQVTGYLPKPRPPVRPAGDVPCILSVRGCGQTVTATQISYWTAALALVFGPENRLMMSRCSALSR